MPGTVSVACKLPHGVILQLQKEETFQEPVMGGGFRDVKRFVRHGKVVQVKGFAKPADRAPDAPIIGGYAITHGLDADFVTEWFRQNKDAEMVERGLIFAHAKPDEVENFSRKEKATRSGLEPVDPDNLPGEFKRAIKTAEVQ